MGISAVRKKPKLTPRELKEARARLNFSQERLAFELGVNRVTVIRWETGVYRIPNMLALALKHLEREDCKEQEETHLLEPQMS